MENLIKILKERGLTTKKCLCIGDVRTHFSLNLSEVFDNTEYIKADSEVIKKIEDFQPDFIFSENTKIAWVKQFPNILFGSWYLSNWNSDGGRENGNYTLQVPHVTIDVDVDRYEDDAYGEFDSSYTYVAFCYK